MVKYERLAVDGGIKSEPETSRSEGNEATKKRDHLRALLDRARGSRAAQAPGKPPSSQATSPAPSAITATTTPPIKCEPSLPNGSLHSNGNGHVARDTAHAIRLNSSSSSHRLEPPAFLPTPRGGDSSTTVQSTPLVSPTNTKSPSTSALPAKTKTMSSPIPSRGGILPTPTATTSSSRMCDASATPSGAMANAQYDAPLARSLPPPVAAPVLTPSPSSLGPHSQHPHPLTVVPTHPMYTVPPASFHAPTCSCAHAYPVALSHPPAASTAAGSLDNEAMRWHHYQANAPPSLTIPPQYYHHQPHPQHVDHHPSVAGYFHDAGAVVQAVASQVDRALAQSISPTMSTTTSSTEASVASRNNHTRHTTNASNRRVSPSTASKTVGTLVNRSSVKSRAGVDENKSRSEEIFSLSDYEDHELHSDFVHSVHMLIPADSFGCLIGPRGEFMKQINAASGCTLSVRDASSFPFVEFDRVLRVYGKAKGICLAQRLVIERIRKHRTQKNDTSYMELDGETMVLLGENFVTKTMQEAIELNDEVDEENEEDMIAEAGELRWLIHMDSVGKIMGSEGRILKGIARETNTTLRVSPLRNMARGSTERAVIITGEPDDIKSARAVIEHKVGGRLETQSTSVGKAGKYFVIPHYTAGFLIGPQGGRVRKIREDTGASIQIPSQEDLPLGYVNRTLHVQGTREQVEKASSSIRRRLQSFMGTSDATAAALEDEIALQLILPVRICSFLLDQRGRLIREINEKAGAHARFLPLQDEEHRICVLYGDMPKVLRAERLVLQFVAADAIANKYANAGGAPPRKRKRANVDRVDEEDDEEVEDESNIADHESDDDSDLEEICQQPSRGRPRKCRPVEDSGRVVVHYSDPKQGKPTAARRSAPTTRHRAPRKPGATNNRNKRRRGV